MRSVKMWWVIAAAVALPVAAAAQTSPSDQVVDRIIMQEKAEVSSLQQYSPLAETYIQSLRPDRALGTVLAGDKYFLGKAHLAKGVVLEPLSGDEGRGSTKKDAIGKFFSMEFVPAGFVQMIYVDRDEFDRQNYKFEFERSEFLGEVRCLVFDVTPLQKNNQGRFMGRIWVEDHDFHIIRFNGTYVHPSGRDYFFHFDSWRVNAGSNQWLPALIYCEERNLRYGLGRKLMFKSQTRLWGYDGDVKRVRRQQELSKVLIEAATPVTDEADGGTDFSPLQEQRLWERQAEDNIVDRLEQMGVMAPHGAVDKVLETVVNNLEVTNKLDITPEVRCRVLMTSTLESFAIGHTLVISRGLLDVLPDEATLATILAHELSHVILGHQADTEYAFYDRMLLDDQTTFRHFGFARDRDEELAANEKSLELLQNSPYTNQLATARLFVKVLQARAREIPNLISPHLGDRLPVSWAGADTIFATTSDMELTSRPAAGAKVIEALPLGGRIKMDPWDDQLELIKSKPAGIIAEREKKPFEVTPFLLYLTREQASAEGPAKASVPANPQVVLGGPVNLTTKSQ